MPKKAKKKIHINKMTRKNLITMCRGRGIALGHAEKAAATLQRVANMHESNAANMMTQLLNMKEMAAEEIKLWKGRAIDHEDEAVKLNTLLTDATALIDTQDTTIAALNIEMAADKKRIEQLEARVKAGDICAEDFKAMWHKESQRATENEDHWRTLSDFTGQQLGALRNLVDLIDDGLVNINNEYRDQ